MAGKITYALPVEKASGKIFGKKTSFIAVTRKVGKRKNGCAVTGVRTTPVSAAEINHRNKFKAVQALARQRMKDPERGPMDMVQWKLNDQGYSTFYGYCFHLEWEAYSEE